MRGKPFHPVDIPGDPTESLPPDPEDPIPVPMEDPEIIPDEEVEEPTPPYEEPVPGEGP